ncbi:hypothetical protein [Pandoraea terrigena]|nr:hypothetical protein [Pandoraea terrigena]
MFQEINYEQLNSRQKENYNFQKVAARLADYGFNCLRLSDDWQGADFIACHIDGSTFMKVQLKGRLTIDKKYSGKDIYISFCNKRAWYLYPHDEVRDLLLDKGLMTGSKSWDEGGGYSWPYLSEQLTTLMQKYSI